MANIPLIPTLTKEDALSLVLIDGLALREFPTNLKNDKDIVSAAISSNCVAFCYASTELQEDKDLIFAAVTQDGGMLAHVLPVYKNNKDLVLIAIEKHGQHLRYASDKLKQDKNFILDAISINPNLLEHIATYDFFNKFELLDDHDIVLAAVMKDGGQLYWAGSVCKHNKDIILTAIYENDVAYLYVPSEMREDPVVVFVHDNRSVISDIDWPIIKRALLEQPDYFLNPEPYMKALTDGMNNPYLMLAQYALNKDLVVKPEAYPGLDYE